jgi:hypothetical protein
LRASTVVFVVLLVSLAAAAKAHAARALPESGELTCQRAALDECTYVDRNSGLVLRWPNDWPVRRLKLVTETGPAARSRQPDALRWISIDYLPDDPANPETSLVHIAVLPTTHWIAQSAQPVPTARVEIATAPRLVAIASAPESNPYPPGSRDADIYSALQPTPEQISLIVRFPADDPSPSQDPGRGRDPAVTLTSIDGGQ